MDCGVLSRPISRRFALGSAAGLAALSVLPGRVTLVSAQQADALAAMGFPQLSVTLTDTSFDGLPESTAAGRRIWTFKESELGLSLDR